MNCSHIDAAFIDVHQFVMTGDVGFTVLLVGLVLLGSSLLFAGEQLVRPLGAVVGGIGGFVAVFVLTALVDPPMKCEVRLIVSGATGLFAAILALCILKTGIFLLGAASLAAVTHLVYDAIPIPEHSSDVQLLGRSGYYYLAMSVSVVVGGILSYYQRANFVRIASSLLGAGCVVLAVYMVVDRTDASLSPIVALVILGSATLGGVAIQRYRSRLRKRRDRRRDQSDV